MGTPVTIALNFSDEVQNIAPDPLSTLPAGLVEARDLAFGSGPMPSYNVFDFVSFMYHSIANLLAHLADL
jgi:hypothetical protein